MPVTLREVLATDVVRAGRPEVLSGGSLERSVRWVHVSEVRDLAGLLRGGELVLTTGIAIAEAPDRCVDYLDLLIDAGATGLIVELGEPLPRLPQSLVDRAVQRDFPVVALHETTRFVDITEQVHRTLVADQFQRVRFASEVHERFTELSLEAAGAPQIVEVTAELCNASVVLEDAGRRVVAYAAQGRPASGLLADWERRSRLAAWNTRTGLYGPEGWMTTLVGVGGQQWARLVITDPRLDQDRLVLVVERAAQALELGRRVERDRLGLHLQAQGGLLTELATGRITGEADASARARALGLRSAPWHTPLVVLAPLERVAEAVRLSGVAGLVGALSAHETGMLLAVDGPTHEDSALDALVARLDAGDPGDPIRIGVGTGASGLLAAAAGLDTARHVAEVASASTGGLPYVRATDVRLPGLLALLRDDPRVQAFAETELGALLAHDARTGGDLVEVLRRHVEVGGNKTELARVTHRSRPALYKLLARIERILGVSLDEPASLQSLGVALLVHDQGR